jgi:hypothetical protein
VLGTDFANLRGEHRRQPQIYLSESNVTRSPESVNTGPGNTYAKGPHIPESRAAAESSKNWASTLCQAVTSDYSVAVAAIREL